MENRMRPRTTTKEEVLGEISPALERTLRKIAAKKGMNKIEPQTK